MYVVPPRLLAVVKDVACHFGEFHVFWIVV